jgi:hypothetical protein
MARNGSPSRRPGRPDAFALGDDRPPVGGHRGRRRLAQGLLAAVLVASAGCGEGSEAASRPTTIAVIGDVPYSAEQLRSFPGLVSSVNADPGVRLVVHLGDIKTGVSPCTTSYFRRVRTLFDSFEDPLVYTPGDNEWTDCDRDTAGGYKPTERLGKVREVFFRRPGWTLGQRARRVRTQAASSDFSSIPENVMWKEADVVFASVHAVGSNNGLDPWVGDDGEDDDERRERLAEHQYRLLAATTWLDQAFDRAVREDAKGVVLAMQADPWHPESIESGASLEGLTPIVQLLAERAAEFERPVLLLNGDSHAAKVDRPLERGSSLHGVQEPVPNLVRLVVPSTASAWTRVQVDPGADEVFSSREIAVGQR